MKNILFYTDTPQTGGAELQMFLLAKFLNKEKFKPILACSNFRQLNNWCEKFKKEDIQVIRLEVKHKHDPRHYTQLRKIIKEKEIDIFHAHIWNPASCRYGFLAANSSKIPIITTEHDPFPLPYFKNIFKKSALKKTNKIITVSENNRKILSHIYPKHKSKVHVIKNGIDIEWWQSQSLRFTNKERNEVKEKLFWAKHDTFIISTVAELHERKGIDFLITAISNVSKKYPNIKLILTGDGPDRDKSEKLAKKLKLEKHITFLGKQKKIPQILKSSDLFILPSKREAFGLVNAEAMINSLAIIATKVGGIPEIVKNEETGILVEPENSLELSNAIIELIESPEKRMKMGEAGYKRVIKYFGAQQMAKLYEKEYLKIKS